MPSDHHRRPPPPTKDSDEGDAPANTLWVGNLSSDTVDKDLIALFAGHGALDCTTTHTFRTHAFVYFRHADEARAAREALQGSPFHGSYMRIEFARPAKPCNHLWIGGISSSTTKEQLVVEFSKFGKIEDCKFLRDRDSALIDYYKIEDAIAAHKNMNGKRLDGEQICVEFLRHQAFRRDWPDHHDPRDGHFSSSGPPEPWIPGPKRHQSYGGRRDGPPSNVLWIGYPPAVQIDEQMLHNAMILFGEIERIKCFPSRNYSFVEFRSIDEARRAKEGLQGRLFNDPKIQIRFSSSEVGSKDNPPPFPGQRGPRPDIFYNDAPFGSLESFGPNNYSGLLPLPGPNLLMGPIRPQGIDPRHGGSEFHEFGGAMHNFPDGDVNNSMPPNWRRRSPSVPGMFPSAPGVRPTFRPMPGGWEGFDMREPKRSRIDGSPADDVFFHARRMDGESTGEPLGFSHPDRGGMGQSQHNHAVRGHSQAYFANDNGHSWRGIIAKGGTHVCHARCVPLGKAIDIPLPGIINCSARTGLDMLTKHYAEASGFDVVFFLPDSEEDFAAYTEFLRYLGLKNRAGVAKLDDGTTLFLVPPSDFLFKVLNVSGPERLYGVVLELPPQSTSSVTQSQQLAIPPPLPHYTDRQQVPELQKSYNFVPQNVDQSLKVDISRPLHVEPVPRAGVENPFSAHGVEPFATQSSSQDNVSKPAPTSPAEVSLTPELLATLAYLLPSNLQPGSTGTIQIPLSASVNSTSSSASLMHDGSMPLQVWSQGHQVTVPGVALEQPSHPPQQLGYQYGNQAPLISQFQTYTNLSIGPDHSAQSVMGSTQLQDSSLNVPWATTLPTELNYANQTQGGQFSLPQSNQQYQLEPSFASQNNYGMLQTADAAGVYAPSAQQLKANTSSVSVKTEQPSQVMSLTADQVNLGTQGQQLQAAISNLGQGTSEGDADKNLRYQSTLQFAANLLHQLQQQQQANSQTVQGSANQQ